MDRPAHQPTDALDERRLAHVRRIRTILRFLAEDDRLAGMRDRIRVFGSAAAGKAVPGDVDAYVDFSDASLSVSHPDYVPGARLMLGVARQFPGAFDPFVRVGKILYARDEYGTGWIQAKRVRDITKAAQVDGRPPADVLAEIRARPEAMGGRPAPRPGAPAPQPAAAPGKAP
jgi:hypothetical protein